MPWWNFWSSFSWNDEKDEKKSGHTPGRTLDSLLDTIKPESASASTSIPSNSNDPEPLFKIPKWNAYTAPQTIISSLVLTSALIGFYRFYRIFLRRIPAAGNISPNFFRKRSVFGKVTSVGDGDNFRIYHTPGGWLAGWGWWRPVPKEKKALKDKTVSLY